MDLQCEIFCDHSSTLIFEWIFLSLAGNNDAHKSFNELNYPLQQTTNYRVSCTLASKIKLYYAVTTLAPSFFIWFFSSLYVIRTYIKDCIGQNPSLTTELAALHGLQHLKKTLSPLFQIFLKLADNQDRHNILRFLISSWSLFQVQSYLPLSIINYGISKHYAGSQVSDRRPLGYLLIGSSFWQVTRKPILSGMGSKFGKIGQGTYELAALERLVNSP